MRIGDVDLCRMWSSVRLFHPISVLFVAVLITPSLCLCWQTEYIAAAGHEYPGAITEYSIEQLMELEFVTMLKKQGHVWDTPAAVYAMKSESIERLGSLTLPDALRSVPGVQVAQHNAHSWSVTARGFDDQVPGIAGQFANKFLVLQDGRSLYTPLFSGVSWEAQDVILDDIKRIEMIRGPGASLWGANAVNGVINIISKDARETQGGLITTGVGTSYRSFGHARYGGIIGSNTHYRVFGKTLNADNQGSAGDAPATDRFGTRRLGFRVDSHLRRSSLTLSVETYLSKVDELYIDDLSEDDPLSSTVPDMDEFSGGFILAHFRHRFSEFSDLSMRAYFDRTRSETRIVRGAIDTYDWDFHHRFRVNATHELIYGAGFRQVSDHFDDTFQFRLDPNKSNTRIASAFIQDEIAIWQQQIKLTIGSKFEHNSYTGFEVQPSARLLWQPSPTQVLWLASSRAVRTPSRGESDGLILSGIVGTNPDSTAIFLGLMGNRSLVSEQLTALEIGARRRLFRRFTLDASAFYHIYRQLRSEASVGFPQDLQESRHSFLPLLMQNGSQGQTYGLEVLGRLQPSSNWEMQAAYTFFNTNLSHSTGTAQDGSGLNPEHQLNIIANFEPLADFQTDFRFRYVSTIPRRAIPEYASLDVHLAWRVSSPLTLTLVGQNLLEKEHAESSALLSEQAPGRTTQTMPGRIQRSFYFKVSWRFL